MLSDLGYPPTSSTGFYSGRSKMAYVWRNKSFNAMLEVISHEATHALLRSGYPRIPKWLNEGLAEYFENIEVYSNAVAVPPAAGWVRKYKQFRSDGKLLPLSEFLTLNSKQWLAYDGDGHAGYTQSWAVVFYLMSTDEGREVVARLLNSVKHEASSPCCFEQIGLFYPAGISGLEEHVAQWVEIRTHTKHRY